jgi:hypothetical protein
MMELIFSDLIDMAKAQGLMDGYYSVTISVERKQGEGTTFRLALPGYEAERPQKALSCMGG